MIQTVIVDGPLRRGQLILAVSTSAHAQLKPWDLNAPIPAEIGKRLYLDPALVAGFKDKLETLVGFWGVQDGNTVYVTSNRPNSFATGSPAIVKVQLGKTDPVFKSVLTATNGINAAIPVLSLSWSTDQRGAISITDSAQFLVDRLPTDKDWAGMLMPVGTKRVVYIESAIVSVVQTSILRKKSVAGNLLAAFTIGGQRYEEAAGSATNLVVALGVREPACRFLGNCLATPIVPETVDALSAADKAKVGDELSKPAAGQTNAAAIVPSTAADAVTVTERSVAEVLAAP